jgi:hypothetical protein
VGPALGIASLAVGVAAGCGSSKHEGAGLDRPAAGAAGAGLAGGNGGKGFGGGGGASGHPGAGGTIVMTEDAGAAGSACERDVSLTAVVLGEPAPFDLVIVADHSESLAWSRDELSSGLQNLLSDVRGRAVRIFLLTPTQYGESSSQALLPLQGTPVVPWQDPATGKAYQDAATTYSQVCTNPQGAVIDCPSPLGPDPYHVVGTWSFAMPEPIAVLSPDMTDAAFEAEQSAVAGAILAIGGTGSPHEQPLCTLDRYITQAASSLPEHAVFLVISDEDDVSLPGDCLAGFTGEVTATQNENGTTPCSSGCDAYRYSMTGDSFAKGLPFVCAAFDDLGNRIPGSEQMGYAYQGQLSSCDGIVAGPCTADEQQSVGFFCESGKVVVSCDRECSTASGLVCSVDLHDPTVNPCTDAFTLDGVRYGNLASYCASRGSGWTDCKGGGVTIQYAQSLSGSSSTQSLTSGTTTLDMALYFRARADAAFAPGAYRTEAIVFEPSFSCSLGMGQSYATNLAKLVADETRLFPLCEAYAPALDGVLDFAQALIQTTFHLTLKDDEDVTGVTVVDDHGAERSLLADDFTYDRTTGVLTIASTALRATDSTLHVEITSDCRPVVR